MRLRKRMVAWCAALALASVASARPWQAATPPLAAPATADNAHRFGAREDIRQISLSPDGTRFAAIAAGKGRSTMLIIGSVDGSDGGKRTAILTADGAPETLSTCRWANDQRIICGIATAIGKGVEAIGFTRLLAINAAGGNMRSLSVEPGEDALEIMQDGGTVIDWFGDAEGRTVLMTRAFVPESETGSIASKSRNGLGVEQVDPVTGKRSIVEPAQAQASEYITDGRGTLRIVGRYDTDGAGFLKDSIRYLYRKAGEREWLPLSTVKDNVGFNPYAVDAVRNSAYGFDTKDGRQALFEMALDGSGRKELIFARPDVDIDGLVRIGRARRVVGVSFATDRRETVFFDPALQKLQAGLAKALPNLPLVSFVDASADEQRLLLFLGSDSDPGHYAIFDKRTRKLDLLADLRPPLAGQTLAAVKPITFAAADGTMVPGYLTLPPGSDGKGLPAIVMPHGGPAARDEWGFDWLAQFFAAQGYAVLQPNYRGSTGYGDAWYAQNGFKSWRVAIGDVNDAGRWLIRQGITTPDKLAIVGWSYGGYAALQSQVLDADLFKAAVAIAPVTDLGMLREEARAFTNFRLVQQFIGDGPHLTEGSPARNAGKFRAPVLIFHGDRDRNVGIGESRLMASRLRGAGKPVELVEYKGLDHQLDDAEARTAMLAKIDAFLRATLKLPPA